MFADNTKCHSALQHPDDNNILQFDLAKITIWRHSWKMSLNQSKGGVLHSSRSQQGKPVKPTCSQKDLGIITIIIYQVSKFIHSSILLVKRGSRDSHEIQLLTA